MFRFLVTFALLSSLLCSVGCRICSTPYDCSISTYIDRHDDYRGSYPLYRGGSIFGGWGGDSNGGYVDYYSNAGNYGVTTPVMLTQYTPGNEPGTFISPPEIRHSGTVQETIGIPDVAPGGSSTMPSVEELINRQRGTMQVPTPLTPPMMPRTAPRPDDAPSDAIPFAPSDVVPNGAVPKGIAPGDEVIIPPSTNPLTMETDPPITLEELRRLDPTIQDVQIISIEDVSFSK